MSTLDLSMVHIYFIDLLQQDTAILHEAIRASNKMWRGEYDSSLRQATSRAPILLNASHLESYPLKGRRFAVIAEAIGDLSVSFCS